MSKIQKNTRQLGASEDGIVSLLVTMVMIVVISLIVLGFAQVARRDQTQQLNAQLSDQAFYAAESGVNDAEHLIKQQLDAGISPDKLQKPTCNSLGSTGIYSTLNPTIAAAPNNVSYSCLTANVTPPTINVGNIGSTSTVVPLNSSTTQPITSLTLNWGSIKKTNPMNGCPGGINGVFSIPTNWTCGFGVVRIDLVPTSGSSNNTGLETSTMTLFVVPDSGASANRSVAYPGQPASTNNTNNAVGLKCTTTCTLKITGLNSTNYYMRLSSEEESVTNMQINATGASGSLPLSGAEAVIDATGKAQNVLRRIEVYVPIGVMQNQLPDYSMESTNSICKRFEVMAGYYQNDAPGNLNCQ